MKLAALKRFRYHALILVGVLIAYVAADVWWHRGGNITVSDLFLTKSDPFASAEKREFGDKVFAVGNAIFPDFVLKWHRSQSPFRPQKDPDGNRYFPDSFPGGYDGPMDLTSHSGIFRQLNEPSLYDGRQWEEEPETIRITLVGFRHSNISFRIEKKSDHSLVATYAVCENLDWGRLLESAVPYLETGSTSFSPRAWTEIENIFSNPGFWRKWESSERVFFEKDFPGPQVHFTNGDDSAGWIFEWRSGSEYKIFEIWCPDGFINSFSKQPRITERVRDMKQYLKIVQIISEEGPIPSSFESFPGWPNWPAGAREIP